MNIQDTSNSTDNIAATQKKASNTGNAPQNTNENIYSSLGSAANTHQSPHSKNTNKRNRLLDPEYISSQPTVTSPYHPQQQQLHQHSQKRQNSQSSINKLQSNKRSTYLNNYPSPAQHLYFNPLTAVSPLTYQYPYLQNSVSASASATNTAPATAIAQGLNTTTIPAPAPAYPVSVPVITQTPTFLPQSQLPAKQFNQQNHQVYYKHSTSPTIATTSTNNVTFTNTNNLNLINSNFNLNSNLSFTPTTTQLTPKLHYQLFHSNFKKSTPISGSPTHQLSNKLNSQDPNSIAQEHIQAVGTNPNYYLKQYSISGQNLPQGSVHSGTPLSTHPQYHVQTHSQPPELSDPRERAAYYNSQAMNPQDSIQSNMSLPPPPTQQPQQQQPQYQQSQPQSQPQSQQQIHQQQQSQIPQRQTQPQPQSQQQPQQQQAQQQQAQQQRIIMTEEEQILITNLQETYKTILKLEVETQQGCMEVNQKLLKNNTGAELNNELWTVYKRVIQLLDSYYDFLLYALSPTSTRTGKPLVSNYRILKRMWVYGVVAFLEVLKNVVAVFVEHEVCACFVAYSFNIISCLLDPELGIECWWAEKLGDLSRMAIALYPARYMDWKMSSVYWYQEASKTQFGHGKMYYHMCSVENDNLEALMLIGKGVTCRDPFVPTYQYLRMIIDNVCSQRNMLTTIEMAMIDFVKIHKILFLQNYSVNEEMIKTVSRYASNFGVDNQNIDFFQVRPDYSSVDVNDKITFWYQKGANFALSNIYHMMGFGICSNPFAKLFDLPDALKERKDKKDKREKRRRSRSDATNDNDPNNPLLALQELDPNDPEFLLNSSASVLDEVYWFKLLRETNKGVIELSMKMFRQYLSGPAQTSTPHVIVWMYYLVSVCESVKLYPASKSMFYHLLKAIVPWKALVLYLNDLLCVVRSVSELRLRYRSLLYKTLTIDTSKNGYRNFIFQHFSENETLWEVWKCWGSLWFDRLCPKGDYSNVYETGMKNDVFDTPLFGELYKPHEDGERYIRILLLGGYICENFPEFGLKMCGNIFKFDSKSVESSVNISLKNLETFNSFLDDARISPLLKFSGYETESLNKAVPIVAPNKVQEEQDSEKEANIAEADSAEGEEEEDDDEEDALEEDTDEEGSQKTGGSNIDGSKVTMKTADSFDFNKWVGENVSPKLPMWDHNSYGFMTDFINNQYPSVLAHQKSLDLDALVRNDEDNEHEEDSEEDDDNDNNSDDHYQNTNDQFEINSEGGSVSAKAPLSLTSGVGTSSDPGNDIAKAQKKPVRGDIGELMDTSITFISLDTNVWLKHCGKIFKCVRSRIFKLAIPLTVFQELRSLRKSNDSLVAESATRAVIIARQLYAENVVLAIRSDGTTASHINETREFEQNENWRLNSDELILQSIKLNDAFGKNLTLGYGYTIGELPELPMFEEPGKAGGVYNGAYGGGYSHDYFPTTTKSYSTSTAPTTAMNYSTLDKVDEILATKGSMHISNTKLGYCNGKIDTTGLRGESLRALFVSSKSILLSKNDAAEFRYNIIISDDHEMCTRAKAIGLKYMRSSEWFSVVEQISFGRCYD